MGQLSLHWTVIHYQVTLTLLHSERPKLHRVLAALSAIGLSDMLYMAWKGVCTAYNVRHNLMFLMVINCNTILETK